MPKVGWFWQTGVRSIVLIEFIYGHMQPNTSISAKNLMMYVLISAYVLKQRKKHAYRSQPREQQPRAGAVVAEGALLH